MRTRTRILLTGGTGTLGAEILRVAKGEAILSPGRKELDITEPARVDSFFQENSFDTIIHCAALARMKECEADPIRAMQVNVQGTVNLVSSAGRASHRTGKDIRFIYVSTDGVYPGTEGHYKETDAVCPYNNYGWSKLGGECAAMMAAAHCIIRTSFFDPKNIPFDDAPSDAYSSKLPLQEAAKAILDLAVGDYTGIINVGSERESEYERLKSYKPGITRTSFEAIQRRAGIPLARDSSFDTAMWETLKSERVKG